MDTLLKTFMQLMCGILIVQNAAPMAMAFFNTSNAIVQSLGASNSFSEVFSGFQSEIESELSTIHIWSLGLALGDILATGLGSLYIDVPALMVIMYLFLPFIAQLICAYKIVSMMIMRMLELIVRVTFAAIPIAFSAQHGFGPESIRYFRGVMACALQPVLMMIGVLLIESVANATMSIAGGNNAGTATGIVATMVMTLSYFVLSAYLGETKQLSQEIIAR